MMQPSFRRSDLYQVLIVVCLFAGSAHAWECGRCTFINNPHHLQCGMCQNEKPVQELVAPKADPCLMLKLGFPTCIEQKLRNSDRCPACKEKEVPPAPVMHSGRSSRSRIRPPLDARTQPRAGSVRRSHRSRSRSPPPPPTSRSPSPYGLKRNGEPVPPPPAQSPQKRPRSPSEMKVPELQNVARNESTGNQIAVKRSSRSPKSKRSKNSKSGLAAKRAMLRSAMGGGKPKPSPEPVEEVKSAEGNASGDIPKELKKWVKIVTQGSKGKHTFTAGQLETRMKFPMGGAPKLIPRIQEIMALAQPIIEQEEIASKAADEKKATELAAKLAMPVPADLKAVVKMAVMRSIDTEAALRRMIQRSTAEDKQKLISGIDEILRYVEPRLQKKREDAQAAAQEPGAHKQSAPEPKKSYLERLEEAGGGSKNFAAQAMEQRGRLRKTGGGMTALLKRDKSL